MSVVIMRLLVVLVLFVTASVGFRQVNSVGGYSAKHIPSDGIKNHAARPLEYMQTPNYDVILLEEEDTDPTWRKFRNLFQPINARNVQHVKVSYGVRSADVFRAPSIRMNRFEVESVLAMLSRREHIVFLHPRNCKPYYTGKVVEKHLVDEIVTQFQKLFQQPREKQFKQQTLPSKTETNEDVPNQSGKRTDDVVEQKYPSRRRPPMEQIHTRMERTNFQDNGGLRDPCKEGYVFLFQNQENAKHPNALDDLLFRIIRVLIEADDEQ